MPKGTTKAPARPTARSMIKVNKRESLRETPIPPGDEVGAAELAARVATNLHEQRRRRDMSLDQLAQRTGVSRAGLSQIETRKTNPSIGVLWKIASGLGIPFSQLIGDSAYAVSVLHRSDAQVLRSADRKFESRPLMPSGGTNQIEVYELRLAAHSRHTSDAHGSGTRELIIVLSGSLRMAVEGQTQDLAAGDSLLFNANAPHVYENPGGSEARYHDVIIYPLR
jgi:XRE family transcriptional regulator, regulator of sulfur utilization